MWLPFACGSAIFAGVTAVLAKIGMQHINSTVATALRTGVVLLFSWLLVLLTGAISGIGAISGKTFLFLILSGCATGASQYHFNHAVGVSLFRRSFDRAKSHLYAADWSRYILDVAQTHTSQIAIHDEKRMAILCHPFCRFCKFDLYFGKRGNSEH